MSKESGMIKVPRKFPPLDPATATEEEIAEREKILAELRAKDHEIDVRNACLDFMTDIRLRLEKGDQYFRKMGEILRDIHDEVSFLESRIDEGFDVRTTLKELSACFFGLAAQQDLFHFAITDNTLSPHAVGSLYDQHFAEVNEKVFQSRSVKCCVHHGESDVLLVQLPPLFSVYDNYQKARGGYPFPTSHLAQYSHELSTQLQKISGELPHYRRYHFAYVHVYNERPKHVIDNDNRDTKQATDTICLHLGITDNPFVVSFANHTIMSKTLKAGSYIFISKDADQWPNLVTIISILEQYFSCTNPWEI